MGASLNGTAWRDRYFASADGLRLYYRDYPAAVAGRLPVLCLPGLTRNCRDFETTALRLQPMRRVLTPDLRGRGRSQYDPHWQNYHPGTYLDDLARLLRDAGVERVILLGTSLGGILAMLIAATAPQVPAAVILNDIGPEVALEGLQRIASLRAARMARSDSAGTPGHSPARSITPGGLRQKRIPSQRSMNWKAVCSS